MSQIAKALLKSLKTSPQRRRHGRNALVRGMTLIEIMVVITIVGLLTAAISIAVIPQLQEAKVDRAKMDINKLEGALKVYFAKKGKYPDTGTGLKALLDSQVIERLEQDPWDTDYVYLLENGKPVITSYGADKTPGGEGFDADISSKTVNARAQQ